MITVIGGGPAGRIATMRLAAHGKKVTLFDSRAEGLGGQCLHPGCMVICAQNDAARACEEVRDLNRFGITDSRPAIDYASLQERMTDIQETIAGVLDTETTEAGVTVVSEHARVEGNRVYAGGTSNMNLRLSSLQQVPSPAVIICSRLPCIPDQQRCQC